MAATSESFVHLARLALAGRSDDVIAYVKKVARESVKTEPEIAAALNALPGLRDGRVIRNTMPDPIPLDTDSRLALVRREYPVVLAAEPTWTESVGNELEQVVRERAFEGQLNDAGLFPTRSLLLTGPPGVGKTLAAKWLAQRFDLPLFTLDLAAVMSSFLGRTGSNLRAVLDFTRAQPCVLLLDEFDAIAKRRDDLTEIGELKRLVTVLLQTVDDWPAHALLVAATNHADLLDPAIWRRFERVIALPIPDSHTLADFVRATLNLGDDAEWAEVLAALWSGTSFADAERAVVGLRRAAVLDGRSVSDVIQDSLRTQLEHAPRQTRIEIADRLHRRGLTQRRVHEITGVSRDTVRTRARKRGRSDG